jgi:CRP-like cAMP-binding protein
LATDERTVIGYMGEGTYFGEIGLLLTSKRSCSVKAKTVTVLYTVDKNNFLSILEEHPLQMKYLRAVGRQRLLTTHPYDLDDEEDRNVMQMRLKQELMAIKRSKPDYMLMGLDSPQKGKIRRLKNVEERDLEVLHELYRPKIKFNETEAFSNLHEFVIIPFSK